MTSTVMISSISSDSPMNCHFISIIAETTTCELFRNDVGNIQLYAPSRENPQTIIELGTQSYVTGEIVARQMGFEPSWT